ncbi:MADS-box transcription factor 47-like [Triticum urartu]|uniref:MADS-box transcription factor 47-like n=1 Tax=Triticum urartu TaxID=4572 RepID=UPI0020432B7E|nr:MADS-box transcription factor 47-like [Triticum urartu]
MPKKDRRSAITYINDDKERDFTFSKRCGGLFKVAADLSAVTSARVAIVVEKENEKMHSFGMPFADPIVDAFLACAPLAIPLADEATTTRIAQLQGEVARLDMHCMTEFKENQLSIKHMKQILEQHPGTVANLIFSKEEELGPKDLKNLSTEIYRVHEEIGHQLPPLHYGHKAMTSGASMIQNMPPSSGPPSNHMKTVPSSAHSPWAHHLPQHQMPSSPPPPGQIVAPQVPQEPSMFHPAPSSSVPQIASQLQTTSNQALELPPPLDISINDYVSSSNPVNPQQNNANPNSTTGYNLVASPLLVNSGVNDLIVNDPFGYESWGHGPSDQPFYNGFLEMGAYMGYNGADVGQSSVGNGGWIDAPPESSSS